MTFLATFDVQGKKFKNRLRQCAVFLCDNCQQLFIVKHCVKQAVNKNHHFHSNKCAQNSTITKTSRKETMFLRHGVEHPLQSSVIKQRRKNTLLKNHGDENFSNNEKRRQTMIERYAVEHVFQIDHVKETSKHKKIKTFVERYGVEHPMQNDDILKKAMRSSKLTRSLIHWKTGEELTCTAGYEFAFVNWANHNRIDFDWQIRFETPVLKSGKRTFYFIDAYIKSGEYANVWIELKGTFNRKNGHVGKEKWEWFHATHPNSQLWTCDRLIEIGILTKRGKSNPLYI